MTDAIYQASERAVLIEDNTNQKSTATQQSYTPLHLVSRHLNHPTLNNLSTQSILYPFIWPLKSPDTIFGKQRNQCLSRLISN